MSVLTEQSFALVAAQPEASFGGNKSPAESPVLTKPSDHPSLATTTTASTTTLPPRLTHDLVTEILEYKGVYTDKDEEEVCQRLVLDLNADELETAARTSYAYWWYVTQPNSASAPSNQQQENDSCENKDTVESLRLAAAQREARRHYVGSHRDATKALASLQHAIALRQKYHVDLLRWMSVPQAQRPPLDDNEKERLTLYRDYIADELEKQMTAVVGLDEEARAMILKGSRTNRETHVEGYLIMQIYVAERAMALTEVASRGRQERVFCVFDFAAYDSQHAPPTLELRGALADLQALYKERLHQLVILDPPFFLNLIYNIVSPFLDSCTRDKIAMVSGAAKRAQIVTASPERQQALQCLLQKEEKYGVSIEAFLHEISFHEYYNLVATAPIVALS